MNWINLDWNTKMSIVEETPSEGVILNWLETSGFEETIFQY